MMDSAEFEFALQVTGATDSATLAAALDSMTVSSLEESRQQTYYLKFDSMTEAE
jgi:hypothetical protein